MNKNLQLDIRHRLMDGTNLVDGEFAGEYDALETQVPKMRNMFGRTVIALGRSMQTDRRQVEVQEMQILDDERIDTYLI
jgi:hypothetical protein